RSRRCARRAPKWSRWPRSSTGGPRPGWRRRGSTTAPRSLPRIWDCERLPLPRLALRAQMTVLGDAHGAGVGEHHVELGLEVADLLALGHLAVLQHVSAGDAYGHERADVGHALDVQGRHRNAGGGRRGWRLGC